MQEAIKCMRHSRRTSLTSDDVDSALKLRNVEPIYGFTSGDSLRFKRAAGHKDLFYIDDKDVEFKDVIEAPLPKALLGTSVTAQWLAIEGVQPAIPENAPVEALAVPADGKKSECTEDRLPLDCKVPSKLSRELNQYCDKIKELTVKRPGSLLFKQALLSLATDLGLQPLVPSFTRFITEQVTDLNNFPLLFALMRVIRSLLRNPHIHIEPYLHQLMPSVLTCVVAKRLGNRSSDNHWELRNFAANLVASICKRFGHVYHNLQPRVTRTLLHAFLDPNKALPQHFGAIQCLVALGPNVVRLLILPNIEPYLQLLAPEMLPDKQKNVMKRLEAQRVYGALLFAAGLCVRDQGKIFRSLVFPPTPPTSVIRKMNGKAFATKMPSMARLNKRKVSMDNLVQQPPRKKIATEGTGGVMPMNSLQTDRQGATAGYTIHMGRSGGGLSSMSRRASAENISGREVGGRVVKESNVFSQAWKEDMDAGHLMSSLFEIFGESLFSFTPKPELSFL